MKFESHTHLLYKQRPYEHSAHSEHHCVLPSLLFLFSSARSYPFVLQNTTSCFELTFWAYGHHGEISSECFFSSVSLCHLGDHTRTLFFSMFPNISLRIINLCPQALSMFLPLPQSPVIYYYIYLIHSFLFIKNWQEIFLRFSTLRGNASCFLHPFLPPILSHRKCIEISHWVHSNDFFFSGTFVFKFLIFLPSVGWKKEKGHDAI